MPSTLLQDRLVQINSEDSIDALQPGNVVGVLRPESTVPTYRVYFDSEDRDVPGRKTLKFYMSTTLRPNSVILWSGVRQWLHPKQDGSGLMLANDCAYESRDILTPGDSRYEELRADLVALGLMR